MSSVPCPHDWTQVKGCVPHSELVPARKAHVRRIPLVVSVVSVGRVAPGGASAQPLTVRRLSSDSGPGSLQSENGRTRTEISQREKNVAELGKVLVLSASAGAGHLRAAQAVERTLIGMGAVREVRHIDVLEYTNKLFRNFYSKAYIEMVNTMPDVLGWLYDYLDKPWKNERRRLAFDKLNTRPFVKLLQQERPDVVVCTHFLPAEIISWLKAKERISTRQAIVVTDFDVHAMWLVHHFEHYFVALDETRAHLQQLGIATEKITVSGIPIDPVFAEQKDKRTMRRKHGLKEDRTTILISAGGFGVVPIQHEVDAPLGPHHTAHVVAACGAGQRLQ